MKVLRAMGQGRQQELKVVYGSLAVCLSFAQLLTRASLLFFLAELIYHALRLGAALGLNVLAPPKKGLKFVRELSSRTGAKNMIAQVETVEKETFLPWLLGSELQPPLDWAGRLVIQVSDEPPCWRGRSRSAPSVDIDYSAPLATHMTDSHLDA